MKANVTFSLQNKALSIELVPESEGDRDFLALTRENMKKTELAARILSYAETKAGVEKITFSLNVPEEKESAIPEEISDAFDPSETQKKRYLC